MAFEVKEDSLEFKQMLREIEEDGGREHVAFVEICDANTSVFGDVGSEKRRAFQKKMDTLKRLSAPNYLKKIRKAGVTPCAQTLADGSANSRRPSINNGAA